MHRLARCGPTQSRTRFWVAQRFSAAERPTLLHERKGTVQPCHPEPIKKRALAPEGFGSLPVRFNPPKSKAYRVSSIDIDAARLGM
jgi:hypothetical protein